MTKAAAFTLSLLLVACTPTEVAPTPFPTEDPRIAALLEKVVALDSQIADVRAENTRLLNWALDADAAAAKVQCCGTFLTWSRQEALRPDVWRVVSVPDTFTLRIKYTATTPVRARIVTLPQFVSLMNGLTVDAPTWGPAASLDVEFHDAEGCANYVLILDAASPGTFSPEISITRAPAPGPTGICAQ